MYSRVPTESRIYTFAGNRYFGLSRQSRTCYGAPCCRCIFLLFASLRALCAYQRGQARQDPAGPAMKDKNIEQQVLVFIRYSTFSFSRISLS
jgi:hypothetical protein